MKIFPSEADFLWLKTQIPLYRLLLERGILIRNCANYTGLGQDFYRIAADQQSAISAADVFIEPVYASFPEAAGQYVLRAASYSLRFRVSHSLPARKPRSCARLPA